ncbi:MAG: N-acetyl-gamma-glutamyl-phosphate reductase [Thermoleophilia bacterium]
MTSATVHVLGAAGYAGSQLAALVDAHPWFTLGTITARADAGRPLRALYPEYRVDAVLTELDVQAIAPGDFAAVCYPHAAASELVAQLVDRGVRVVDVSADHRLRDPALYPAWYGFEHPRPDLLAEAVYGLPEAYRERIRTARVVANPGCYPTAALLALLPLVGHLEDVIIDAKSGVSGAGRAPSDTVHFCSVTDNLTPYKVLSHRHTPEIGQELGLEVTFTPHLMAVDRGELTTCYARLTGEVPDTQEAMLQRYRAFYDGHPFVEVVDTPPGLRGVQRTNIAQICPLLDAPKGRLLAFGVIDNLVKGAAGQALQNLNLMAGRPETEGLV